LRGLDYLAAVSSPWTPQLLLTSVKSRGVIKSTDAGKTWKASNKGIRELSINIEANQKVPGSFIAVAEIPLFSKDFGRSWQYNVELGDIAPKFAKISSSDPEFQVIVGDKLAISTSGGKYWDFRKSGCQGDIEIGPQNTLFQNCNPIIKSTDFGNTWRDIGPPLVTSDENVNSFCVDPTNDNIIYAAINRADPDSESSRLVKTTDGGRTWKKLNTPPNPTALTSIKIHPKNPKLLYATTLGGTIKSVNAGSTWIKIAPGFRGGQVTLDPWNQAGAYILVNGSIWRSDDGGTNWMQYPTTGIPSGGFGINQLVVSPWNPKILYAATHTGLYHIR
jgi:photosystem II stability/assembly factor-like uncharacterized protein